jgi:hypothetical protein
MPLVPTSVVQVYHLSNIPIEYVYGIFYPTFFFKINTPRSNGYPKVYKFEKIYSFHNHGHNFLHIHTQA